MEMCTQSLQVERLVEIGACLALDALNERHFLVLAEREIQAHSALISRCDGRRKRLNLYPHSLSYLSKCGLVSQFLEELLAHTRNARHLIDHIFRKPNRPGVGGEGMKYALSDPPARITTKSAAPCHIKFLGCFDQPYVPFLDQIEEIQAEPDVLPGHADHQEKVRFDQPVSGCFVACQHLEDEQMLLFSAEEGIPLDIAEVLLDRLIQADFYVGDSQLRIMLPAFKDLVLIALIESLFLHRPPPFCAFHALASMYRFASAPLAPQSTSGRILGCAVFTHIS